ncbi:hypothetical protein Tco_0068937, partial [Tanacetum coccineum]
KGYMVIGKTKGEVTSLSVDGDEALWMMDKAV